MIVIQKVDVVEIESAEEYNSRSVNIPSPSQGDFLGVCTAVEIPERRIPITYKLSHGREETIWMSEKVKSQLGPIFSSLYSEACCLRSIVRLSYDQQRECHKSGVSSVHRYYNGISWWRRLKMVFKGMRDE